MSWVGLFLLVKGMVCLGSELTILSHSSTGTDALGADALSYAIGLACFLSLPHLEHGHALARIPEIKK